MLRVTDARHRLPRVLGTAQLSSTIPVAGSAYPFSYVVFGELWGWLVGWALILELLIAAAVVMVVLIAQSRVLFAMGRDGLLPSTLEYVSHRYSSPARACAAAGIAAALVALYPAVASLEQLLVVGALFTLFFCSVGVLVLRYSQPDLERGFHVPAVPWVPLISAAAIVWLALNVTPETWRSFGIWMLVGVLIYIAYGRRHSHLALHSGHSGVAPVNEHAEPPGERPAGPGRHSRR